MKQKLETTKQQIVTYLKQIGPSSAKQIIDHFGFNQTIIHRHLNDLIEQGLIYKTGSVPRVLYIATDQAQTPPNSSPKTKLGYKEIKFLDENFMSYDSDGTLLNGHEGFFARCEQRDFSIDEQYKKYYQIISKIDSVRDRNGMLDTFTKLAKQTPQLYLDGLYVCDSYQIGHFGKSTLGSLAFYAKQSQNKQLIDKVSELTQRRIQKLISDLKIDAICYAPVSIKRSVQFMDELKKKLSIQLPELYLEKFFPQGVVIPQKSIKGTAQRIKNSTNTIFVKQGQKHYKRVLLIDDFIASGATLNISAHKLKERGLADQVIGLAIVGNLDLSYEVINEV